MKNLTTRFVAVGVVVFGMAGRGVSVWGADMHVVTPGAAAAAMPGAGPNLKGYPYVPMAGRTDIDPKIVATVKNPNLDEWMGKPMAVVPGGVAAVDPREPLILVPGNGLKLKVPFSGPATWNGEVSPHPEIFHPGPTVQVTPIVPPGRRPVLGTRPEVLLEELGVRVVPGAPQAGAATRPELGLPVK